MRNRFFAILVVFSLLLVLVSCSKKNAEEIGNVETYKWLKPGTTLIYEVNYYGNTYDFTVTLQELGKSVKFYYEMLNQWGNITISEEAMKNAIRQKNSFSGGDVELEDATTVFLSREVFRLIKNGASVYINPGTGLTYVDGSNIVKKTVLIDGEAAEYGLVHFVCYDLSEYYVLDDDIFPLIISMVLDFSIELKEIITE